MSQPFDIGIDSLTAEKSVSSVRDYSHRDLADIDTNAKSFYIETFGCQMNVHDSEKVAGVLLERVLAEALRPRGSA